MDKLVIQGPCELAGEVAISSSKNASLPILASTLLYRGEICLDRLPQLSDISFFLRILESLGAKTTQNGNATCIDASSVDKTKADYDLVRKMRASVLVLGPLLSRFGKAEVSLPGGCAIGTRPVDIHLKGLEAMGANITIEKGYIIAECEKLKGAKIELAFPSVGATENLMMAAVLAQGQTIIENAAREPEIVDHAVFLRKLGAKIQGEGTSRIIIDGVAIEDLQRPNVNHRVIGDRIEAATFIIAALMTNSQIKILDFNPHHLEEVLSTLEKMGAKFNLTENSLEVLKSEGPLKGIRVETAPFPGFPTDVQAQLMSLAGVVEGNSMIAEHIFENRFMHVPELVRMGMDISLDGHSAMITGKSKLSGAPVMCTDLRASAALVLAALVAEGETHIGRIYHLDRGYEKLEEKFQKLGAKVIRVKE